MTDDPRFTTEEIDRMVAEHNELVELVPQIAEDLSMMVDDLYGTKKPTVTDPDRRVGGRFTNGGVKLAVPPWLVAIIVAGLGMLGTITAALIVTTLGGTIP